MKIVSIVGARPQFIKLSPLSKEIRKKFDEVIIHTGQHFDKEMSQLFFEQLEIPVPDYNLEINGGSHGEQTGQMLIKLEQVILNVKPDLIIVFGDTNSTLAGVLVAAKLCIRSIHIEAGLRSFNRRMPEEINRIIADNAADYLFAPTLSAMENLENEGLGSRSYLTGDIMVASLVENIGLATAYSNILADLNLTPNDYHLLTLHRPYNVDDYLNLNLILQKLASLKQKIIFPVHPRTKNIIVKNKLSVPDNIVIIKPLGYFDFIVLEKNSRKIITDSGGIQKEAYILKRPCITLRSETEWVEPVEDGWNLLVDIHDNNFISKIESFNPNHPSKDLFGSDVAKKMSLEIDKIFTK